MLARPDLCPCCAQPLPQMPLTYYEDERIVLGNGRYVQLADNGNRIFAQLFRAYPQGIKTKDLIELCWCDPKLPGSAAGGPLAGTLHKYIWDLNNRLRKTGYRVRGTFGKGAIYRLVRVPEPTIS